MFYSSWLCFLIPTYCMRIAARITAWTRAGGSAIEYFQSVLCSHFSNGETLSVVQKRELRCTNSSNRLFRVSHLCLSSLPLHTQTSSRPLLSSPTLLPSCSSLISLQRKPRPLTYRAVMPVCILTVYLPQSCGSLPCVCWEHARTIFSVILSYLVGWRN